MDKKYLLLLMVLLSLTIISAETLIYQQNTEINLKVPCFNNNTYCSATAVCNITIQNPDGTLLVDNKVMTNSFSYHNYTLLTTDTTKLGSYATTILCIDNGLAGYDNFIFKITGNGKEEPEGVIVVLFVIFFLVILGFFAYLLIVSIGHLLSLDFDLKDLSYNFGLYFVLFGVYMLSKFYLGNPDIEDLLLVFVQVGAITHLLVPLLAFLISFFVGGFIRKKINAGRLPIRKRYVPRNA